MLTYVRRRGRAAPYEEYRHRVGRALLRTFPSWSLMLEIEGRWPWQRAGAVQVALHGAADERPPSSDRTAERAA